MRPLTRGEEGAGYRNAGRPRRTVHRISTERVLLAMSTRPDDHAPDLRLVIPAPRRHVDLDRIMADDELIESVRLDRVTRDSPRVAQVLAAWRRSVLA